MSTLLTEEFERIEGTDQARPLETFMLLARTRCQRVLAVCVGAGDVFVNRYWPVLAQKVNQGVLHLVIADFGPLELLAAGKVSRASEVGNARAADQLGRRYAEVAGMIRAEKPVRYLDLSDENDCALYRVLASVNVVFILLPDHAHVHGAREWLGRADLIVIEKPYNRDLVEADEFEKELRGFVPDDGRHLPQTFVVCIDHYLAKLYPYIAILESYRRRRDCDIGCIRTVEFRLCETGGVEAWRSASLQAGMVYDLFPHILAMSTPFVDLRTISVGNGNGDQILVARHDGCPVKAESYAWFDVGARDFLGGRVRLRGAVGKGVGRAENGHAVLGDEKYYRLVGENGTIVANLEPGAAGTVSLERDGECFQLADVAKGHKEMLESIFSGQFTESPVGGLTGQTALQILRILTSVRARVERVQAEIQKPEHLYQLGQSVEMINQKAVPI